MVISVFINVLVHCHRHCTHEYTCDCYDYTHRSHFCKHLHILFMSESFSRIEKPTNQNLHDERTQLEINIHKNISFNNTPNLISSPRKKKLENKFHLALWRKL